MKHIIAITNQKGGVGKTTTAVNLSAALAVSGKKTLLVDLDPQGNATTGMGVDKKSLDHTIYHVLTGQSPIRDVMVDTEVDKLQVLPSRIELVGIDVELVDKPEREKVLKRILEEVADDFDYIVIDCPPSLNLLTVNSMTAATALVIPLQCEFYALEGLGQLISTIRRIKKTLNPHLGVAGILLTMFDSRTNLSHQVADDARSHFKHLVFKTRIPRNVRLGEAPSFGQPIIVYDITSAGAQAYLQLAAEIMKPRKKKKKKAQDE